MDKEIHSREVHVKTGAEIGVIQLRIQGTLRIAHDHQKLGRNKI